MTSHLIPPYGGTLVDLPASEERSRELKALARDAASWTLTPRQSCDLELLLNGAFSPLTGFMNERDYHGVCESMRLANGTLWPIPIALDVTEEAAAKVKPGSLLFLRDVEGVALAALHVEELYRPDLAREAELVYGSTNPEHPAVNHLLHKTAPVCIGGRVEGLQLPVHYDFIPLRQTPAELRKRFAELGWRRIVAFQTRNPLHRAHEYALVYGLETLLRAGHNAGACLNPLIGETKGDDVDADVRMHTYEALINTRALGSGDSDPQLWGPRNESVPDRVILLGLDIKMFYGGPSEAIMHAIYRQNFGFTDLIIGRKHADAPYHDGTPIWGDFDAQEIFDHLAGDLQIRPLRVGFAAFYQSLGRVDLMENHPDEKPVFISGQQVRKALLAGRPVDPRIMRESTAAILAAAMGRRGPGLQ